MIHDYLHWSGKVQTNVTLNFPLVWFLWWSLRNFLHTSALPPPWILVQNEWLFFRFVPIAWVAHSELNPDLLLIKWAQIGEHIKKGEELNHKIVEHTKVYCLQAPAVKQHLYNPQNPFFNPYISLCNQECIVIHNKWEHCKRCFHGTELLVIHG